MEITRTWKTVQSNCLDSLFLIMEKSAASGLRKSVGSTQWFNKFCTVTRISISVSFRKKRKKSHLCKTDEPELQYITVQKIITPRLKKKSHWKNNFIFFFDIFSTLTKHKTHNNAPYLTSILTENIHGFESQFLTPPSSNTVKKK